MKLGSGRNHLSPSLWALPSHRKAFCSTCTKGIPSAPGLHTLSQYQTKMHLQGSDFRLMANHTSEVIFISTTKDHSIHVSEL